MTYRIPSAVLLTGLLVLAASPASAQSTTGGLSRLDANSDGVISRKEALAAQVAAFKRLDADASNSLSVAELPVPVGTDDDAPDKAEKRARERARRQWFRNVDTNDDDSISLAEYQHAMTPYFDGLDENGDGVVDANELRAAFDDSPQP